MRLERIGMYCSGIRTKVYDVERKELLGVFESRGDAARYTGIDIRRITDVVRSKSKVYSKKLKTKITFR
jgi:hypothetical protein